MTAEWEKNYLAMLGNELANGSIDAFLGEIDGSAALILSFNDPNGGRSLNMKIGVEHIVKSSSQLRILVKLFGDIDEKIFADMGEIAELINEFLVLGNVAVFRQRRTLFYNYAFAFTEDMTVSEVTRQLGLSLDIVSRTALAVIDLLNPLIKGGITAEELISRGIAPIQ